MSYYTKGHIFHYSYKSDYQATKDQFPETTTVSVYIFYLCAKIMVYYSLDFKNSHIFSVNLSTLYFFKIILAIFGHLHLSVKKLIYFFGK